MTSLWLDRETETLQDILPSDGRFDDLVIGGGLTGLTTALLLARSGRRVGLVEARSVGAVTTGHTTAKVSLLQGTKLSRIMRRQTRDVAAAYLDANREGMEWLLRFCEEHAVPFQRRDAVTFAADPGGVKVTREEHDVAAMLGLPVTWRESLDVPFPTYGGVVLPDQAQFDPMDVVVALVAQLRLHGGTVHEGRRAVAVSKTGRPKVTLDDGEELSAEHLVLATGTPILDRGLHFAQLQPKRSYLLAFKGWEGPIPMCLSTGSSSRSVRDAEHSLLVGGSGHVVGRTRSESAHLDELRRWTEQYFPGVVETHAWSAQDYSPFDEVPIVGRILPGSRIMVATGFDKWGMTNAVAAAHTLSAEILGGVPPGFKSQVLHPAALLSAARINAGVAKHLLAGGLTTRRCTHLGGPLRWNDAEQSWDCPLHGSRFADDGCVLEGPATRRLRGYR